MLHLNGPNGGRTFTDSEEIPKTVTGYGNAQISTAYSEFGGASLELDGSSYLSAPPSTDWNFSGDFTIDFWWYQRTAGGYQSDHTHGDWLFTRHPELLRDCLRMDLVQREVLGHCKRGQDRDPERQRI